MANRLKGRAGYPADDPFKPTFHADKARDPDNLRTPSKIFVCSMADLFGEWVPTDWITMILDTVRFNPQHTFIFLTKNPKRYSEFDFPENAWIGYSTTGPLYHKWEPLTDNIKFVSVEPLGGPLYTPLNGFAQRVDFNWLIVGKETGNRKGKMIPKEEWIEEIIRFTTKAGISLFIKDSLSHMSMIQEFPKLKTRESRSACSQGGNKNQDTGVIDGN